VPDEVWENAAIHFDQEELVAIVSTIAVINAFNRLNVILQQSAGDYQLGQFA
jgi:alkylhydroperoxidase family enzyme